MVQTPVPLKSALQSRIKKVSEADITKAIEELVENMMDPKKPFRLPRPCGPLVHPTLQESEILLQAASSTVPLEAVITFKQALDDSYLEIDSPGAAIAVLSGDYYTYVDPEEPQTLVKDLLYSFPSVLRTSTGSIVAHAQMRRVIGVPEDTVALYQAWNPDNQRFEEGFVWVLTTDINNTAHGISQRVRVSNGDVDAAYSLQVLNVTDGSEPGTVTTAVATTLSSAATVWSGGASPWIALIVKPSSSQDGWNHISTTVTAITTTYVGVLKSKYSISNTPNWNSLVRTSDKFCISAIRALCSFEGGIAKAGHISCALVPHGRNVPLDAEGAIQVISKLPPMRKHSGTADEGACVSWMPDRVDQLWLREMAESDTRSQSGLIAFKCPPGGSAQPPQFRLYMKSNSEFENYDPVYGASSCVAASQLLAAIVDVYGTVNPCSGNPSHIKNIAATAKKIAADPTVRAFASMALKAGKYIVPTLLALV